MRAEKCGQKNLIWRFLSEVSCDLCVLLCVFVVSFVPLIFRAEHPWFSLVFLPAFFRQLLSEWRLREIARQQLFQKAFVVETRGVVMRPYLFEQGYRDTPGQPHPGMFGNVVTAAQEAFNDQDFGGGHDAHVALEFHLRRDPAHRRVNHFALEHLVEFRGFGGALFDNHGVRHIIAQPFRALAGENRDDSHRIKWLKKHVGESDQIARQRGEKTNRAPVFLNHAQFQPPFARRLAAPDCLEKDEISEEDQKAGDDHYGHDPEADPFRVVENYALHRAHAGAQAPGNNVDRDERDYLDAMINRASEKAVTDRGEREIEFDVFRGLDD